MKYKIKQTTSSKRSPRLCLLLKTLLFLLCIYIKRATAAPASSSSSSSSDNAPRRQTSLGATGAASQQQQQNTRIPANVTKLGATKDIELQFASQLIDEGLIAQIRCPVDQLIKNRKFDSKSRRSNSNNNNNINNKRIDVNDIIDKISIFTWLKNDKPIEQRLNGNPILKQVEQPLKLTLANVGESDEGKYTCVVDYTKVPKEAYDHYELYSSASFLVQVDSNYLPDTFPVIENSPKDAWVNLGDNITFECKSMETLSHSTTYWFKSCQFYNTNDIEKNINNSINCVKEFENDFDRIPENQKQSVQAKSIMRKYTLKHNAEKLFIRNISDSDLGYYGCLVTNGQGFSIKRAFLKSIDSLIPTTTANIDSKSAQEYATTRSPAINKQTKDTQLEDNNIIPHHHNQKVKVYNSTYAESRDNLSTTTLVLVLFVFTIVILIGFFVLSHCPTKAGKKKKKYENLMQAPIVGCNLKDNNERQHLPVGNECPDIYNVGKKILSDGFISGRFQQANGHLMTQSACCHTLDHKGNNSPSITSNNSNSDEASSWGKTLSSQGDNSRAFYHHTSGITTTTVPMYDHPPSTGTAQLCQAIVQDACVINPTYGFLRPETNATDWTFPRRDLIRLVKIGEGEFGEVWKYIARQKDGKENFVAVKQLRENRVGIGDRERLELIAEIEIMKSINEHPNVIKLLNYCVDDYQPILLIMEYAENGKLQDYLRSCRKDRKNYGCIGDKPTITSRELVKFSYHITKGMEYVASKGIIHRDLASRNILVSKDKICKVADFGFARRITDDCAYERSTANPVPIKWMAPEALVENKFTSKSDVFSLGILMWEIVTLGGTPYEKLNSSNVYNLVTSGGRLERPDHCKEEFFNIMCQCWKQNPAERPSFEELAEQLEKLLLSENDYIELDQYPEHAYYNVVANAEKETVNNIN